MQVEDKNIGKDGGRRTSASSIVFLRDFWIHRRPSSVGTALERLWLVWSVVYTTGRLLHRSYRHTSAWSRKQHSWSSSSHCHRQTWKARCFLSACFCYFHPSFPSKYISIVFTRHRRSHSRELALRRSRNSLRGYPNRSPRRLWQNRQSLLLLRP